MPKALHLVPRTTWTPWWCRPVIPVPGDRGKNISPRSFLGWELKASLRYLRFCQNEERRKRGGGREGRKGKGKGKRSNISIVFLLELDNEMVHLLWFLHRPPGFCWFPSPISSMLSEWMNSTGTSKDLALRMPLVSSVLFSLISKFYIFFSPTCQYKI